MTPAFHFKILEDFMEIFVEKGQKLSEILMQENKAEAFDLYPYINKCALDIVCGKYQFINTSINLYNFIKQKKSIITGSYSGTSRTYKT